MNSRVLNVTIWFAVAAALIISASFPVKWLREHAEARKAEQAALWAGAENRIWPDTAVSIAIPAKGVRAKDGFVHFVDLRSGSNVRMPTCSVRSIESIPREEVIR